MRVGISTRLLAAAIAVVLAGAALGSRSAVAAGRGNQGSRAGQLRVSPTITASPVTASSPLNVCVSGLEEGNVALLEIPYRGTPQSHSNLAYRQVVDASGGFCFDSPPSWTQMDLTAGIYSVRMSYSKNDSSRSQPGPNAEFEVTAE